MNKHVISMDLSMVNLCSVKLLCLLLFLTILIDFFNLFLMSIFFMAVDNSVANTYECL